MEGTREGMTLALPTPECDPEGNYLATQCETNSHECWCVDNFGTEIPNSSNVCLLAIDVQITQPTARH
ncbi:hypothetical protein YQE_11333, partial [Dendroctonus ponderosae]